MLVLSRKIGDSVVIDGRIRITVTQVRGSAVRLAIEAPREVPVLRSELCRVEQRGGELAPAAALQTTSA